MMFPCCLSRTGLRGIFHATSDTLLPGRGAVQRLLYKSIDEEPWYRYPGPLVQVSCGNGIPGSDYTSSGPYGPGIPGALKEVIEASDFIMRAELPRSAIPTALALMDLLVLPYNPQEPYLNLASPTKLFEYIEAAKPILCTKCTSFMDIDDEGGIVYVGYSPEKMARAIDRLINRPDVRKSMGGHSAESMQGTPGRREYIRELYQCAVTTEPFGNLRACIT